jgi:hypothetical protein
VSARIDYRPGPGYLAQTIYGAGYDNLSPVQRAACSYGGHAAAGSAGCEQDMANVEAHLTELPAGRRGAARREARRLARRLARRHAR